jgi:hypothetical protein
MPQHPFDPVAIVERYTSLKTSGIEEAISTLEYQAALHGWRFCPNAECSAWTLSEMTPEESTNFRLSQIHEGDFLEVPLKGGTEQRGPVTQYRQGGKIYLLVASVHQTYRGVPIAIQPHTILAVWREGKEVARFVD